MSELFFEKCKNCNRKRTIEIKGNFKKLKYERNRTWFCSMKCYLEYHKCKSFFEQVKNWWKRWNTL